LSDMALLKINATGLPYVNFGDSAGVRVGDWVVAIGNPFGLGGTVTAGIVSALHRNIGASQYERYIQTDASINQGNSGGPLFDLDGNVVGINTAIFSPTGGNVGLGFSIPAELARADIVIACTAAPHAVIHGGLCRRALEGRAGREIVLIDIAVPRDIDPVLGRIPGVFLYDIDDLQNVIDRSYRERLQAAHQARGIIEQESRLFMKKIAALPVVPVIFALKQQAEQIKHEELAGALAKLGPISEHDQQTIAGLAQAIAGRILHEPVTRIKNSASENRGREYARLIAELFNLSLDDDDADHTARNPR